MVVASYDSLEQFFIKFKLKYFKIIKSPRKKKNGLYQRGNKYLFFDWWNETLSIRKILAANIYWVFMPDCILRILHLVLRTTNEDTEHHRNKGKCLSTVVRIENWQEWNPGGWPESLSKWHIFNTYTPRSGCQDSWPVHSPPLWVNGWLWDDQTVWILVS